MQILYAIAAVIAAATALVTVVPDTEPLPMPAMDGSFPVERYVVPPSQPVAGHAQGFFANDWWQWLMAAPAGQNPQDDSTGHACARDQRSDVWYLAGAVSAKPQRRTCTIPAGLHLFLPLSAVYDTTAAARPMTCAQVRASAAHVAAAPVTLRVTVDGSPVPAPERLRVSSKECFDLTARVDPAQGVGSLYPTATEGHFLMLRPLPPGRHLLTLKVGKPEETKAMAKVTQDVTYDLTVLPPDR